MSGSLVLHNKCSELIQTWNSSQKSFIRLGKGLSETKYLSCGSQYFWIVPQNSGLIVRIIDGNRFIKWKYFSGHRQTIYFGIRNDNTNFHFCLFCQQYSIVLTCCFLQIFPIQLKQSMLTHQTSNEIKAIKWPDRSSIVLKGILFVRITGWEGD